MLRQSLLEKARSLMVRADQLPRLRETLRLPPGSTLAPRQWLRIETQLGELQLRLRRKLRNALRESRAEGSSAPALRRLNARMGRLEFELAEGFTLFDTYMDLLTQRNSPELGPLLAGCDVLAEDALHRPLARLTEIEAPLVHCDRGFGASILRQGVRLQGTNLCPLPLIQIPYTRLKEKHNLTSIAHEVGHQAIDRLSLAAELRSLVTRTLKGRGFATPVCRLYAQWLDEIAPDCWAFCATGVAQAGGAREIFSLAPTEAFDVNAHDPHPPPYLRALLAFEWCRQCWGRGLWDPWEEEWHQLYPLGQVPPALRAFMEQGRQALPWVAQCLLETPLAALRHLALRDLFTLDRLDPRRLRKRIRSAGAGSLSLEGLSPCEQLSAFRIAKEDGSRTADELDHLMTLWLTRLGSRPGRCDPRPSHDQERTP